jgi:hypothetical protein
MSGNSLKLSAWAAIVFWLGTTNVCAGITFCNKFSKTLFVAIAYPQDGGSWMSRGWLELAPGDCAPFDSAIRVTTFYFRAESTPYVDSSGGKVHDFWGQGKSFAMWEDNNFQYYDAENEVLNSTLKPFTRGPEGLTDSSKVTVTFTQAGSTVEIPPQ